MESIDKQKAKLAWIENNKKALDDIERKRLFIVRWQIVFSALSVFINIVVLYLLLKNA